MGAPIEPQSDRAPLTASSSTFAGYGGAEAVPRQLEERERMVGARLRRFEDRLERSAREVVPAERDEREPAQQLGVVRGGARRPAGERFVDRRAHLEVARGGERVDRRAERPRASGR